MKRGLSRILVLSISLAGLIFSPVAGQDDDQQRDIEAKEVVDGRQPGINPTAQTGRYQTRTSNRRGRVSNRRGRKSNANDNDVVASFPLGPPPRGKRRMTLGVTLWRVRPATDAEDNDAKVAKERMWWDRQEHSVVVKRISDDSPFPNQDLLQMTIEYLPDRGGPGSANSNQAAYLYVVNREQFPDGHFQNARLIFPTLLTYRGDNRLLPGKTVTLPDPTRPFRIKRDPASPTQVFETYTIILSPLPLDSQLPRRIGHQAMELSPRLIRDWEGKMGITEARVDLRGGVGQTRTERERGASGDPEETRSTVDSAEDLTQDDLPPQTVYRKVAKPGGGMLVNVRLPFQQSSTKP